MNKTIPLIDALLVVVLLTGPGRQAFAQQPAVNPHGVFSSGTMCSTCHSTEAWSPLKKALAFDHSMQTDFPLTGSHTRTDCAACHLDLRFDKPQVASTECASCHLDVHQGALGETCIDCHNTTLFQDVEGIALHAQTDFPLTGTHTQISCITCHTDDVNGAFSPLDSQCIDCHEADYDEARIFDHVAAGFPTRCESCHNDLQWEATEFNHLVASSGFDLIGTHDGLPCESCHRSPDLTPLFAVTNDQNCIGCHQSDYDDNHAGSGFPTTCLECHGADTWSGVDFDHLTASNGFELLGAHDALSCTSCHSLPELALTFQPAPSGDQDCITCHQPDYDNNHAGSGFPTTCLECHGVDTWSGADFDHLTASRGFELLGAHYALSCASCHYLPDLALTFQPPPSSDQDCITCHQPDYTAEHAGTGFSNACLDCHTTSTWKDANFDHDGLYFPIYSGKHGEKWDNNCSNCHLQTNNFSFFSCEGACHQHDQARMDDKHHEVDGYAYDFPLCLSCHPDGEN